MGDRLVGRLLDAVRAHGLMDKTVILVTSDHGEEFFDHGNCDHVRFLYHEIVKVPFILHVPGLAPEGQRINEVVPASISVSRTFLELVGVEHDMPGVSLVPVLEGKRNLFGAAFSEADSQVGALGSRGTTIAMTGDNYKLISYLDEGTDEAYDLATDPSEQLILPDTHTFYAQRRTLRTWHASVDGRSLSVDVAYRQKLDQPAASPTPRPSPGIVDEARAGEDAKTTEPEEPDLALPDKVKEQLRSLGYLDD
jgi:arylsulfatase A-like enzyme